MNVAPKAIVDRLLPRICQFGSYLVHGQTIGNGGNSTKSPTSPLVLAGDALRLTLGTFAQVQDRVGQAPPAYGG